MPGERLDPCLRHSLETLFVCDFEDVRIHRDPAAAESARRLGAAAYTVGSHIVFAPGRYQPESLSGRTLIAHELAHVLQQRGCRPARELQFGGPGDLEAEAHRIAGRVVTGHPAGRWSRAPVPGLVQMHKDVPCPGPPEWKTLTPTAGSAARMGATSGSDLADIANLAIEQAYAIRFGRSRVLFSSDYKRYPGEEHFNEMGFQDGQLRFARELIKELRGLEKQNQPDIVDFQNRCFYEIKTAFDARLNPAKVKDQILDLYRKADSIARKHAGTSRESIGEWSPRNATWYPPHVLPVPNDPDLIVCTGETDYTKWTPGLVLYELKEAVVKRKRPKARQKADANDVDLVDLADEVKPLWPVLQRDARVQSRYFDRELPHYVILFSPKFYNDVFSQFMDKKWDLLRVRPPFLDVKNPIGFQHLVVGGCFMLAAGAILVWAVAAAFIVLGGAAAAGETIAVVTAEGGGIGLGGVGAEGAQITSLAAYRALRAAPVAAKIATAAGVLLVLGMGRKADARPVNVSGFEVGARIVPVADFRIESGAGLPEVKTGDPNGPYFYDGDTVKQYFKLRNNVVFDGRKYVVVGMVWPHD